MINLYPPQQKAVDKLTQALRSSDCAGNWSHTGTGKTIMGLSIAGELGLTPLVVAPLAGHATWRAWASDMGVDLLGVVNSEKLKTGKTEWVAVQGKGNSATYRWSLDRRTAIVLIDEVHRGLTGVKTQAGAMSCMLRPQGIKTLLMSATPFSSPLNLRAIGYLMRMHDYSLTSFYDFCRRHGCRASRFHRGLEFNAESRVAKVHLQRINEFLRPVTARLTVDDLGEFFGDNVVEPTLVSLQERDRAEVEAVYAEMDEKVRKGDKANPLTDMLRARQRAELLSVPIMADMVEDSVAEGRSVYVALSFRDSVAKLRSALQAKNGIVAETLTGDTKPADRETAVDLFQADKVPVLIATLGAGGLSISLHRTREEQRPRTSILRPSYSAPELLQALGRIHRAGMVGSVVQRILMCAETVEERVYRRLMVKVQNIATLTNGDLI